MDVDDELTQLEALEALPGVLDLLEANPFSAEAHRKHISLAQAAGMEAQVLAARERMIQSLACTDDIWLPYLSSKVAIMNKDSVSDLEEILDLHTRSLDDYLSLPLIQARLTWVLEQYEEAQIGSDEVCELFSEEKTRVIALDSISRVSGMLSESHLVWNVVRAWEESLLDDLDPSERSTRIEAIHKFYLDRLRVPHSTMGQTQQDYSAFCTKHCNSEYENRMVKATKMKQEGVRKWDVREPYESTLENPYTDLSPLYLSYLSFELHTKKPDVDQTYALYQRAISYSAKESTDGEESFWLGFFSFLRTHKPVRLLDNLRKAVRSVQGSGIIWAEYIKSLERSMQPHEEIENVFQQALATGLIGARGIEDIVSLYQARAGAERRLPDADVDAVTHILMQGIGRVQEVSEAGDPQIRLESYLASYLETHQKLDEAASIWDSVSKLHKHSYLVWTRFTEFEIRRGNYVGARSIFTKICSFIIKMDWPEAVFGAYTTFEEYYGSVRDQDVAMKRVETESGILAGKRSKEAQQAAAAAYDQPLTEPSSSAVPMDVIPEVTHAEETTSEALSSKRKIEEVDLGARQDNNSFKKQKTDELVRDREHTTVFVSGLPRGTEKDDVKNLFRDCGDIREIDIQETEEFVAATVEFLSRESILTALTRDKKKVNGEEVNVHFAWKSTLYVTNFPDSMDDAGMRRLFSEFGVIFKIRWPSKKYKATRRFAYVQFLSPSAANEAVKSLNGKELETGFPLSVAISDPQIRKSRTDAKSNERTLYVTNLANATKEEDLNMVFKEFGAIKSIRVLRDAEGRSKRSGFVEFHEASAAVKSLALNSTEVKKKKMGVTIAEVRHKQIPKKLHQSIRVYDVPEGTQDALLQQAFEKITTVVRAEIEEDRAEAIVELDSVEEMERLLSEHNPFSFNGTSLPIEVATAHRRRNHPTAPAPRANGANNITATVASNSASSHATAAAPTATPPALFRPPVAPKSRLGLGGRKPPTATFKTAKPIGSTSTSPTEAATPTANGSSRAIADAPKPTPKGQNDFRAMLLQKKE